MGSVRRVGRHSLTLALATAVGVACSDMGGVSTRLQAHRMAWEALDVRSYDYTLDISCECLSAVTSPVRLQVRAGVITSLSYVYSGEPVAEEYRRFFPTIDGLFGVLQDALEYGADSISVEYDSVLHFPRTVFIDYDRPSVDDEKWYTASDFVDQS